MVITDKFVYIHKPKTGGTFVTDALIKLYEGKWNYFMHAKLAISKRVHYKNRHGKLTLTANKHGGCLEIPKEHQDKLIVSTIRNPFDHYVSQYEFGWWKRNEWHKYYKTYDEFALKFPTFPDITFQQFMDLMAMVFNPPPHQKFFEANALGWGTVDFINNCFYNPSEVLNDVDEEYISTGAYKKDMFPIHFIFTHKLNKQLHSFLAAQGYPEESIVFIESKKKVLPQGKGRTPEQKWEKYYTPELKELVRRKDWLLFELFPEFDLL